MNNLSSFDNFSINEKTSKDAQSFIAAKIKKLHDEGYEGDQAVAIAYSYARKAGYDVPKNEEEKSPE